ncbi:hypothetical protein [Dactylosporangium matsuzakiense]|uniref:Uncharacterized protein n=1 Tax=Dactylosporangium matsuzakiense TaxID=53360 RepID=A0A9W6NSY4_9ACTN|nr:hypothetical protein [Dactylosporangium matsuzakiense]GLL08114.1 hypothetical protein GCM10017581_098740 [Dactylosporangium matsuzakiense]
MRGPFGILWWLIGSVCVVLTIVFTVVWPHPRQAGTPVWRLLVLHWAHPAVWLLFAASCFLRAGTSTHGSLLTTVTAQAAGVLYLVFLGAVLLDRR